MVLLKTFGEVGLLPALAHHPTWRRLAPSLSVHGCRYPAQDTHQQHPVEHDVRAGR